MAKRINRPDEGYEIQSLTGDWILVNKCVRGDYAEGEGPVLLMDDYTKDTTNFGEVMMIGPNCQYVTDSYLGQFILCPEHHESMKWIADEMYIVRESWIMNHAPYVIKD